MKFPDDISEHFRGVGLPVSHVRKSDFQVEQIIFIQPLLNLIPVEKENMPGLQTPTISYPQHPPPNFPQK